MSSSEELPLEILLKQPRTLMVLLDTYEGLAQACDQMTQRASQGTLDTAAQTQLRQFEALYVKRVGVDVAMRQQVRRRAREIIQAQSAAHAE